jgi:hypothetical protein
MWVRGASFRDGVVPHLESLAAQLRVAEMMPLGELRVVEFVRMLAKIAHGYAVAEMGIDSFDPFLIPIIRDGDTSNTIQYIGGMEREEPPSAVLHQIALGNWSGPLQGLVTVRLRLLAVLGTPTYWIVVGRRK